MANSNIQRGVLVFDCASGIAGDMSMAALIDAGVPVEVIEAALDACGIGGHRLQVAGVVKSGISATNVTVDVSAKASPVPMHSHDDDHDHQHGHDHDHSHSHTHYSDIQVMLARLEGGCRERAEDMFARVARAEAKLHGTTIEQVAFHEVGAVDSIVDIVGTAAALAWLDPIEVRCASVAMGHGTVDCAHGKLPVPAPAALEILREAGGITDDGGIARELCTPTGAAILASAVTHWAPAGAMRPLAVGYGAGDADLTDRPNVLRVRVGAAPSITDEMVRVEANVDDMNPEVCEHVAEVLFEAGAVDVWWTAITMKKSRPALQLSALCSADVLEEVLEVVLTETTSIGVRFDRVSRQVLERRSEEVSTPYGALPIKLALLDGAVVNAAPEYEPCRRAARQHKVPLKRVFAAVLTAYEHQ
jgi:uncharacterized protein (TIGR00299 family) protein